MNTTTEGPTDQPGGGTTSSGPPNPLEGLTRSADDRWIAGVAGGVARHFDVAPWIVRLAGIALASVGIGVPVYLLAWILLPSDTRPSIATEHGWNHNTVIAVCVLIVVACIALFGIDGLGPSDHALGWRLLPWLAIGTGIYLLVRYSTHHEPGPPSASPPPPPPPPPFPQPPFPQPPAGQASDVIDVAATTSTVEAVSGAPMPPTATGADPNQPPSTAQFGNLPPPRPSSTASTSPPRPPSASPRIRRSPFLTPLTIFALLGLFGAAVLAGGHGWARPAVVGAIALCVVAVALVTSAFVGRARGLIAVGILIAIPLLVGLAAGPRWDDWHDRDDAPHTTAQLHRTYDRGIGRTVLDLRDLTLPSGHTTHVRIDQIIGQVIIWLPPDARTTVDGHVSFGEIASDRQPDHNGGTGVRSERTLVTGTGTGRLDLAIDLTAGQIRIHDDTARVLSTRSGGN